MKNSSRPKTARPSKSTRQRRTFVCPQPPRNVRPNRLEDLPPRQSAALKQWLFHGRLTYHQIQARLLSDFGCKISITSLSKYYMRHRQPIRVKPATSLDNPNLVFDVVFQSTRPVRIQIFRNQLRLRTKIQKVESPR